MTRTHEEAVLAYFRAKADAYDRVDEQVYWRLSDSLLWDALETWVLPALPEAFSFLDAGGGTGRWTDRLARARADAQGALLDISAEMTRHARAKTRAGAYADRVDVVEGPIERADELLDGRRFELIFNFHNVLGFVADPAVALASLARRLAPGGLLVTLAPSAYHAAYFALGAGRLEDAESALERSRGRFTEDMPYLSLFTPASLTSLYEACGLLVERVTGFPTLVYPAIAETRIEGSTSALVDLLGDADAFARVFALERAAMARGDIAGRGNNLLAIGRLP